MSSQITNRSKSSMVSWFSRQPDTLKVANSCCHVVGHLERLATWKTGSPIHVAMLSATWQLERLATWKTGSPIHVAMLSATWQLGPCCHVVLTGWLDDWIPTTLEQEHQWSSGITSAKHAEGRQLESDSGHFTIHFKFTSDSLQIHFRFTSKNIVKHSKNNKNSKN